MPRIYSEVDGKLHLREGDYGYSNQAGYWIVRPPGHHAGGIPNHTITEHPDGTITVYPSILLHDFDDQGNPIKWHGYLEYGIWREV